MKAYIPPKDQAHSRLYKHIQNSPAWLCLSASDQRAYLALMFPLGSTNNGILSLTNTQAKHHGIKSKVTLAKNLRALTAVGLIARTRQGGAKRDGTRLPNLYRFTDRETLDFPHLYIEKMKATNEWKGIESIAIGRAKIRQAELSAKNIPLVKIDGQEIATNGSKNSMLKLVITTKNGLHKTNQHQKKNLA